MIRKTYLAKVYDSSDNFITVLKGITFNGFRKQLYGGLGQLSLTIPRKFDDFDEDYVIKHRNKVVIYCIDQDTGSDGVVVYTGYIPRYNPTIDGTRENVEVLLNGYVTEFAQTTILNGLNLVFKTDTTNDLDTKYTDADAVEVVEVVRKLVDLYQALRANPAIDYDASSIPASSGNTMAYTFNAPKGSEAIDTALSFAPEGWWWYVGADNMLNFKAKPSSATHSFIFGRDFESVSVEKNIEEMVNVILFDNGGTNPSITKLYRDEASINEFGEYYTHIVDSRVSKMSTADFKAQSILDKYSQPVTRTRIRIFDNNQSATKGRDIESINPGDTCQLLGFNEITSKTFNDNMLIVAVDYTPDYIEIELEDIYPNLARSVSKNVTAIDRVQSDIPRPRDYLTGALNFHTLALQNSWVSYDPAFDAPGYYRDGDGIVHLHGLIKSGTVTAGTLIATLPVGYRPPKAIIFPALVNPGNAVTSIVVASDGTIKFGIAGNATWTNLDGICFPSEAMEGLLQFPTLKNSWVEVSASFLSLCYHISPTHGKIRFWGRVGSGSSIGAIMSTLTSDLSPKGYTMWDGIANDLFTRFTLEGALGGNEGHIYQSSIGSTTNVNLGGRGIFPRRPSFLTLATLQGAWANVSNDPSGWEPAAYYKDEFGIVHLQGLVTAGVIGTTILTLPAGYRPKLDHVFLVNSNNAPGELFIQDDGVVVCAVGNNTHVNLSGIEFIAAPS